MRNLAKYFLTLMVIGGGFYAAQPHRHPDQERAGRIASSNGPVAEPSASPGRRIPLANRTDPLPVAALADVDRLPLFDTDRTIGQSTPDATDRPSVAKQPTLRRQSPAESSSPATSLSKPACDEAEQPPTKRDATAAEQTASKAKPEARKPTIAKPQPKKPKAKEAATATSQDDDFRPPELAREYRPNIAGGRMSQEPDPGSRETARQEDARAKKETEAAEDISDRADVTSSPTQQCRQDSSDAPPHVHRIAEGDTLRRLAEQYLGSRDRYLDIFHANQDVLFDPQLIPIGVEILIPERIVAMAQVAKDSKAAGNKADARSSPERDAAENEPRAASDQGMQ